MKKKAEWEINEPRFNQLNYNESLLTCLNYYSVEVDSKLKQQWALEYYNNNGLDIKGLEKLNPMLFDQVGVLARLVQRGVQISDMNKSYTTTKYNTLKSITVKQSVKEKKVEKDIDKEVVKNWNNANQLLSEIDAEVDAILTEQVDIKAIRIKLLINELNLKKDDFEFIKGNLTNQIKYFNEVLTDEGDLHEGYAHLSKKVIKKCIAFLEEVFGMCGVSRILIEGKTKEKTPAMIIKSLQYLIKDEGLGIKSINPEKIIGAAEVWVYDIEKRKLGLYKADEGSKLTVKGTTILNWSFELSSQKTIRKPEEIIKKFTLNNKSELRKEFEAIKSVDMEVKGRTNKNVLILRSF